MFELWGELRRDCWIGLIHPDEEKRAGDDQEMMLQREKFPRI